MPRPSSKTESSTRIAREMHQHGASVREIAKALGKSHATILSWFHDWKLTPNGRNGRGLSGEQKANRDAATLAAEIIFAKPPPKTRRGRTIVRRRLRVVQEQLDRLGPLIDRGEADVGAYVRILQAETLLAKQLEEMRPPIPPDPEKDVTNLEVTAALNRRLERMIADAEERCVCVHCGKKPFERRVA